MSSSEHSMSNTLTSHDYNYIATACHIPISVTTQRLQLCKNIEQFTVDQLKIIIKYLRGLNQFYQYLPHLRTSGNKSDLIQSLHTVLKSNQSSNNNNNNQPVTNNNMNNGYRPSVVQPPTYSHTYQHPNHSNIPQPQYRPHLPHHVQTIHQQHMPLHSNGTLQQQPPHLQPPPVQHTSQHSLIDVESTLNSIEYKRNGRSPYENVEAILGSHTLIHGTTTHINWSLSPVLWQKLKRNNFKTQHGIPLNQLIDIQLRVYDIRLQQHIQWGQNFRVRVNNTEVSIPQPKTLNKLKQKGLHIIKPLLINDYCAMYSNNVTIDYSRTNYQLPPFHGIVVCEVVTEKDTSELLNDIKKHALAQSNITSSSSAAAASTATTAITPTNTLPIQSNKRECAVCHKSDGATLLRCSQCKSVWYCDADHQRADWNVHKLVCKPPSTTSQNNDTTSIATTIAMKSEPGTNTNSITIRPRFDMNKKPAQRPGSKIETDEPDNDISETETMLSLRCPLSIDRIQCAAKGRFCDHLTCFDVETYLMYCQQSSIWQCFTPDTQLMCIDGFKYVDKISLGDKLATYNEHTKQIEFYQPLSIICKPGTHTIVDFANENETLNWNNNDDYEHVTELTDSDTNHVAISVTTEHDMYVNRGGSTADNSRKDTWSDNYSKVHAQQLITTDNRQRIQFMSAAVNGTAGSITIKDILHTTFAITLGLTTEQHIKSFLEYYGYWLGDGSISYRDTEGNSYNGVVIYTTKDEKYLDKLLSHLPVAVKKFIHPEEERIYFYIVDTNWFNWFNSEYGGKYNIEAAENNIKSAKWILEWVFTLSQELLIVLIDGLRVADGSMKCNSDGVKMTNDDIGELYTSSTTFRDEVVQVLILAGYAAYFKSQYTKDSERSPIKSHFGTQTPKVQHDCWCVCYSRTGKMTTSVLKNSTDIKTRQVQTTVYCPTVPPHHLVIARKAHSKSDGVVTKASKPIIIGQCPLCYGPLPYDEIVIDPVFNSILKCTHEETEKIKVLPNGDWIEINSLLNEPQQSNTNNRKRKNDEMNNTTTQIDESNNTRNNNNNDNATNGTVQSSTSPFTPQQAVFGSSLHSSNNTAQSFSTTPPTSIPQTSNTADQGNHFDRGGSLEDAIEID